MYGQGHSVSEGVYRLGIHPTRTTCVWFVFLALWFYSSFVLLKPFIDYENPSFMVHCPLILSFEFV